MPVCDVCSQGFPGRRSARTCSDACRAIKNRDRQRAAYAHYCYLAFETCEHCNEVFAARAARRSYCYSATCAKVHNAARMRAYWQTETGREIKRQAKAKDRARRKTQGLSAVPYNEASKARYQRRRALKKGVEAEVFLNSEIFERDGWICGLCDEPVDQTLAHPDPMSPSLDHVLPLSAGGPHTRENTQLAHLSCNVRKGARTAA